MNTFQELGLEDHLLKAVTDLGFEIPTEVQLKTIPLLLEKETDLVGLAQTGLEKQLPLVFRCFKKLILIAGPLKD